MELAMANFIMRDGTRYKNMTQTQIDGIKRNAQQSYNRYVFDTNQVVCEFHLPRSVVHIVLEYTENCAAYTDNLSQKDLALLGFHIGVGDGSQTQDHPCSNTHAETYDFGTIRNLDQQQHSNGSTQARNPSPSPG
jgi:hypothetical protein